MEELVRKPMSVARVEFMTALTDLINNSGLPAYVIEPIIKDTYVDVRKISQQQYMEDNENYIAQLRALEAQNCSE